MTAEEWRRAERLHRRLQATFLACVFLCTAGWLVSLAAR